MATPRQQSEAEVKLEVVKEELKRLQRIEKRFKNLLATIRIDHNEEVMPDQLIDMADRYYEASGYHLEQKDNK